MPRFSDTEKKNIQQKLLTEGEKLFVVHGLKKVTIDELVKAANIAKATFYTFYESKEYLYLDIVQEIQKKIFIELNKLLDSNFNIPGKMRVRQTFGEMSELMMQYPILSQIEPATIDILSRRVSEERLLLFYQQNTDAAQAMHDHGISFICNVKIASIIFQTLYQSFISMQMSNHDEQSLAIGLMLDGIIDKIIID